MEPKRIIFRLMAALIAIGGAIVSVHASMSIREAHLSYETVGGAGFCTTLGRVLCSSGGNTICKVTITINDISSTVTAWGHNKNVGVCLVRLTPSPTFPIPLSVSKTIPVGSIINN
jgi:hypothetical protein